MILYMGNTRKRHSKRRSKRKQKGAKRLTQKQTEKLIKTLKQGRLQTLKNIGMKERVPSSKVLNKFITKAFSKANTRHDEDMINTIVKMSHPSLPKDLATKIRPAAETANRSRTAWRRQASAYAPQNAYAEGEINIPLVPRHQAADNPRIRRGTKRWVHTYPAILPSKPRHYGFTQADIHESARYPMFSPRLHVVDEFTNHSGGKTKKNSYKTRSRKGGLTQEQLDALQTVIADQHGIQLPDDVLRHVAKKDLAGNIAAAAATAQRRRELEYENYQARLAENAHLAAINERNVAAAQPPADQPFGPLRPYRTHRIRPAVVPRWLRGGLRKKSKKRRSKNA
jgi:hypothetical protein